MRARFIRAFEEQYGRRIRDYEVGMTYMETPEAAENRRQRLLEKYNPLPDVVSVEIRI